MNFFLFSFKIRDHHYKSSSHSRPSNDDSNRGCTSSKLTTRTIIYKESSSTSSKTLQSFIRQVVQTSSFYNTSASESSHRKPLTIGSEKQSRAINSELYHSEIYEDDDERHELFT